MSMFEYYDRAGALIDQDRADELMKDDALEAVYILLQPQTKEGLS